MYKALIILAVLLLPACMFQQDAVDFKNPYEVIGLGMTALTINSEGAKARYIRCVKRSEPNSPEEQRCVDKRDEFLRVAGGGSQALTNAAAKATSAGATCEDVSNAQRSIAASFELVRTYIDNSASVAVIETFLNAQIGACQS